MAKEKKGKTDPSRTEGQPRRADYPVHPNEVPNGNRRPLEVHEFAEIMRHWREQSSQSTLLVR